MRRLRAITFTIEELVGDLDQTMLSGVIVAAALAAVVEHTILGGKSDLSHLAELHAWALPSR